MATHVQERPSGTQLATEAASLWDRSLADQYREVRRFSEALCAPLVTEDYVVQTMPDVSPTKWHLAHVSWFWETFLLRSAMPGYQSLHPQYNYLFNSYYNAIGERHCRPLRGIVARPTVDEVYRYRAYVDRYMLELLEGDDEAALAGLAPIVTLGLHHEQQHQELMVTDFKHVFAANPLRPTYLEREPDAPGDAPPLQWLSYPGGVEWIGHAGGGFAFDNENPRHRQFLQPFRLASRLATNGEYLEFIRDGGYRRPELWLSAGWATIQTEGWNAPYYWAEQDGRWWVMTLAGFREVALAEPVCHLSYFEADAFARWAGARLPTEAEWEVAAAEVPIEGTFVDSGRFHPAPVAESDADGSGGPAQMFGDVWQWTQSSYSPYPGFKTPPGAVGEYNGKFMCNQYVLRGASCATSRSHARRTYRNFFPPDARWQFTGLRLARDV